MEGLNLLNRAKRSWATAARSICHLKQPLHPCRHLALVHLRPHRPRRPAPSSSRRTRFDTVGAHDHGQAFAVHGCKWGPPPTSLPSSHCTQSCTSQHSTLIYTASNHPQASSRKTKSQPSTSQSPYGRAHSTARRHSHTGQPRQPQRQTPTPSFPWPA